jgi:hypothetical protein
MAGVQLLVEDAPNGQSPRHFHPGFQFSLYHGGTSRFDRSTYTLPEQTGMRKGAVRALLKDGRRGWFK